jgi:hypothetical protein
MHSKHVNIRHLQAMLSEYVFEIKRRTEMYIHDWNRFIMYSFVETPLEFGSTVSYSLIKQFHILLYALIISPVLVWLIKQPHTALHTA